MLKLVGTDGKRFYSWDLEPGSYILGRKAECDWCVADKTVSRNHARVEIAEGLEEVKVFDLGSHNGTSVNGDRIDEAVLKPGDAVSFGNTEFRLEKGTTAEGNSQTHVELARTDPLNSVYLDIDEALKPLPTKVTDKPDLLPTIFDMAKMLVRPEPKDVMLQRSLEMISRVIPAERIAILFVSEDQNEVWPEACLTQEGKDPGAFTLSRTIVNEIITQKHAILICDPEEDPRFAEQKSIIMSALKSALAVPLFDEGRVLGILYADTTSPHHRYEDEHLRVMATFGNLIASRLLNYELLEERQAKQVMEAELSRASGIQKKLLVTHPPCIEGYSVHAFQEQSRSVGGDLYDTVRLSDGRLLIMVADVSGKGMGAALLMSNILASFRILYEDSDFGLRWAIQRVSEQLLKHSDQEDFATIFAATVEPGGNKLRYVNGGHNPPMLVRKDGSCQLLQASGIMIGAFPGMDWDAEEVEMNEGDLLFVFSDGIPEAARNDEMYGEDRAEKLIVANRAESPETVANRLMEDLNGFMGDAPRSDDITMMLLKKESS